MSTLKPCTAFCSQRSKQNQVEIRNGIMSGKIPVNNNVNLDEMEWESINDEAI